MIETMLNALQYEFMQRALIAGLLVSIACGVIGTYVVIKRVVFISGGIAHAAYGGIGLGYFLGISPTLGAVVFSLLAAFGMGAVLMVLLHHQGATYVCCVLWGQMDSAAK